MFTGLITDVGIVKSFAKDGNTAHLVVETNYKTEDIAMGASICCNGCCLTVVKKTKNTLEFELSPETIEKTAFLNMKEGDEINLERSLKVSDELGGHIVTGHVDGIAEVVSLNNNGGNAQIKFKLPLSFKKYIAAKGSITINGVSLTLNNVENDLFEVNIIPHTLQHTNLRSLKVGSIVNFETDLLAKYLEKLTNR